MAKYNFLNLNEGIRRLMLSEVQHDNARRKFFFSPRFNANGRKIYMDALKAALTSGSEETLQAALEDGENFNMWEAQGKKVSNNIAANFAQSEFNHYYVRAICAKAIELKKPTVEVYRAYPTASKKHKSDLKIGIHIKPERLLEDMRKNVGSPSTVLPELTAGLSIKLGNEGHSDLFFHKVIKNGFRLDPLLPVPEKEVEQEKEMISRYISA